MKSPILFLLMTAFCGFAQAGQVTVKGSDTMVILCQKWAEAYMKEHSGTNVQVTGGGSGTGLAALLDGTTDIATCSRTMKAKEETDFILKNGAKPEETKVALDGLAIYVNDENPLKEISIPQLEAIFTGKVENWKELGGADERIILYSRENNSGTYTYFKEHVLKEKDFSTNAQAMPGTAALINAVARDPKGIGYGGIAYGSGVKVLPVKAEANAPAITPSMENVVSGKYPISRYLYFYTNPKKLSSGAKSFLEWVVTDTGQKVVENIGYYPLPKKAAQVAATPALAPAPATTPMPVAAPALRPESAELGPVVKREEIVAVRETQLAQREEQLALREKMVAEREKVLAEREAVLSVQQ